MGLLRDFDTSQRRRGLAESTILRRHTAMATFIRQLDVPLFAVDSSLIEAFLDTRHGRSRSQDGSWEPLDMRTRYAWLSNLSVFYQWAIREGLTEHDPTERIDRPKLRNGLPRPISEADLASALDLADPMMRAWIMLAATSGLRCCEIARLQRDDVLDSEGVLRVVGKGDKERIVALHPECLAVLRAFGMPSRGHVFRRPTGAPWPAALVSRYSSVFLHDIGIDATLHQCRHRFASRFHDHCDDLLVLADQLGHSNMNTTRIYAKLNPKVAKSVVDSMPIPTIEDEDAA